MTTTGYGADARWETPFMNLLVVWFQLSGVIIGFVTLRILVIPPLRARAGHARRPTDVERGPRRRL